MNATTQVITRRLVSIGFALIRRQVCRLTKDRGPGAPADDGVLVLMAGVLEDAEEHESSRDRSVQDAEEDQSRDHEGEGDLLEDAIKRAECWCSHVLVAGVNVDDGTNEAKYDDLGDCAGPKRLGEVPAA